MKRTFIFLFSLVVEASFLIPAQAYPVVTAGDKEQEARTLAQQMLTGSKVVVRVYDNWQTDPRKYTMVSVILTGLSVSFDGVKQAYSGIDESTVIVITGKDQPDKAVAAVIGNFVHVDNYRPGKGLSIWPPWSYVPDFPYWVFTDALGDPIPNAEVEVQLHNQHHYSQKLPLEKTVLDGKGRLKSLAVRNTFYRFLFVVSHPKYGKAITERFALDGQNNGHRIVPLVPKGSEAAARSIKGHVVDSEGYALEAMPVASWIVETPQSSGLSLPRGAGDRLASITDEQGWFTLYMPIEKNGILSRYLIPADSKLTLAIIPPKSLNLHEYHQPRVTVGSEVLITLSSMNPDKHFHTFTFEDDGGIISDPQELKSISIGLFRGEEGRFWRWITYDQWKDGCLLLNGELRAQISRWNRPFHFRPIELTSESPKGLVFRAGEQIIYEGEVVEGNTGKPMPGVLVMAKDSFPLGDPSYTHEQLEAFRAKALAGDVAGSSHRILYEHDERVTLTDENGRYRFVFLTGLKDSLGSFIALEEGYFSEEAARSRSLRNNDEIIELPAIKMLSRKGEYLPDLIFEDQFGNIIIDPNKLGEIQLRIERDDGNGGRGWYRSYSRLLERNENLRGTYYATLDWDGQRYTYDPVEVDWGGPDKVFFKVKQVAPLGITYQGRVIDGVTAVPIPGAIVMSRSRPTNTDASGIQPEQWEAVNSKGPQCNPADPAFIPFREAFGFDKTTRADQAGQFQLSLKRTGHSRLPSLTAVQQGYLCAQQYLSYVAPEQENNPGSFSNNGIESGAEGYIKIPPMKLFPAATVGVEPNLPHVASTKSRVRFYMRTFPDDPTPWLKDFWGTPINNRGARVLLKYDLRQNEFQTVNVLADTELILQIVPMAVGKAPAVVRGVKLEKGEFLDLGRLDFPAAFLVTLTVVGPAGEPVEGVRTGCSDADGLLGAYRGRCSPNTDANGEVELYVPEHSKGELFVSHYDRESKKSSKEGIPFKVAGRDADDGKVFTLQLSEEMYSLLIDAELLRRQRP